MRINENDPMSCSVTSMEAVIPCHITMPWKFHKLRTVFQLTVLPKIEEKNLLRQ